MLRAYYFASDSAVFLRHCALYKFTYLLTYQHYYSFVCFYYTYFTFLCSLLRVRFHNKHIGLGIHYRLDTITVMASKMGATKLRHFAVSISQQKFLFSNAQNPLDTFPIASPQIGKLPTCCQLVTDLLATRQTILTRASNPHYVWEINPPHF